MTSRLTCNALSIVVSDMEKAAQFYRLCGLALPVDAGDQPHVEAQVTDGFTIMFDTAETIRTFDPEWQPPAGGPPMALAIQCESPTEVDSVVQTLVDAGHTCHLEPFDAFWGQRYAVVKDPDGNPVDFYAPLSAD